MPTETPSITSWNRLEPVSRDTDVGGGLRAVLLDPAWLLARQWQMGEFAGEDAGSLALTTLEVATYPLEYAVAPDGGESVGLTGGQPLEALVEREPEGDDRWLRVAAETGAHFLRLLRLHGADDLAPGWTAAFPLPAPSDDDEALDPVAASLFGVVGGRVPDGRAIAAALGAALGPDRAGPLPPEPAVPADREVAVRAAAVAYLEFIAATVGQGAGGEFWRPDRLGYAFSVTAGGSAAPLRLDAASLDEDRADWWSFDLAAAPPQAAGVTPFQAHPTRIVFRGMPASRFWEVEDVGIDLGAVGAAPDELIRLLLLDFALVFGQDWSLVPLPLPAGAIARVAGVQIVDTFGRSTRVRHQSEVDGPERRWRMFEHSGPAAAQVGGSLLLIAPTLVTDLHGEPVEEVLLLRDELAELAWAVEKRVPGASGRAVDRGQGTAAAPSAVPAHDGDGHLRYVLQSDVPRNWFPLLPRTDPETDVFHTLRRGSMAPLPGADPPSAAPAGRLLADRDGRLEILEEALPREGVELLRRYRYVRSPDGETHVWLARSRRTGRGEASSGLEFDALHPRAAV